MTTWAEVFQPVMTAHGRQIREGQSVLGQAIIDVVEQGGSLIGEASTGTGKSLAVAIPMIDAIKKAKARKKSFRCVISTETKTLQTQICHKDLPELQQVYGGFTFKKLLGRSNYLCLNNAKLNSRGNAALARLVESLEVANSSERLGAGERSHVEGVLRRTLTTEEWERLAGSSKFCGDNQCNTEKCYSSKARAAALAADIVVVNHAILATDIEMKISGGAGAFADGMLGPIDVLAVDEGHKLEEVLVSQWTQTLSDWELADKHASVINGIDLGRSVISDSNLMHTAVNALEGLQDVLTNIQKFFVKLAERDGQEWKGSETALSMKWLRGSITPELMALMNEYETMNPSRLADAQKALESSVVYLKKVSEEAAEQKIKGLRKINKGLRAAKDLLETVKVMQLALSTKDGIVQNYGIYGAVIDGWSRKNGEKGMTLRLIPLDVSAKAKAIWQDVKTNILISATLRDLTEGTFRYVRESLAFPDGKEIIVGTPFQMQHQQLVYVTPGEGEKVEGAQYDFEELVNLIKASRGRTLVLFTSRKELDYAADELRQRQMQGDFPYMIYVQETDSDKDKLAKAFKEDISSVLLATKSFFTGFDAPGETVTTVAMVKWPNPRYSTECKMQIAHWRGRGFHRWYEMRSLTDLQQAAGRLVRSADCKGVVAILDHRVSDEGTNVFKTASTGVRALGSPYTKDIKVVDQFLSTTY